MFCFFLIRATGTCSVNVSNRGASPRCGDGRVFVGMLHAQFVLAGFEIVDAFKQPRQPGRGVQETRSVCVERTWCEHSIQLGIGIIIFWALLCLITEVAGLMEVPPDESMFDYRSIKFNFESGTYEHGFVPAGSDVGEDEDVMRDEVEGEGIQTLEHSFFLSFIYLFFELHLYRCCVYSTQGHCSIDTIPCSGRAVTPYRGGANHPRG